MRALLGTTAVLAGLIGTAVTGVIAADVLPSRALPLSSVLATAEQQGVTSIVEANFDDGVWEVEGFRGEKAVEVHLDPLTGKILSEHADQIHQRPAANSLSASAIAKKLEDAGYKPVLELDWEVSYWEAEAHSANGKRKLHVAVDTGKVLSDRVDD